MIKPSLRYMLIKNYIGKENYYKFHKETRFLLMKYALEDFRRDLINRFGSIKNYREWFAKQNGFKNYGKYILELIKNMGFKSLNEYRNSLARKKGFKNRYEAQKGWLKRTRGISENEYRKLNAQKMGFKSRGEYYKFLDKRK